MGEIEPVESRLISSSAPFGMPSYLETPTPRHGRQSRGKPLWVILQTGYRTRDGSVYGYGTSSAGPTRKLLAVCRSADRAKRWLRRLKRWAAEGAQQSDPSQLIPTYEIRKATGVDALAGPEPALFVGPAFYAEHGRAASLRRIVLDVRESHTALRREARRRRRQLDRS